MALERKIENLFERHFSEQRGALLVTGARQVGKTYSIRRFAERRFRSFIEINFIENVAARRLFEGARDSKDILLRLSAIADKPLCQRGNTGFLR